MKKLLVLLFSILISFNSYGEWVKVTANVTGDTYYIDKDTIREHGGYVYYWGLKDLLKPDKDGDMSNIVLIQGDCGFPRYKIVSNNWYTAPMGRGTPETDNDPSEWDYYPPGSVGEEILKYVCDYVK